MCPQPQIAFLLPQEGFTEFREIVMGENITRREAFSCLGIAAALLGVAAPTTVLTVSDAEAETAGMERRQGRRTGRQERRQSRRTGT